MTVQSTSVLTRLTQPVAVGRRAQRPVGGLPQVSLLPGEVREAGAVAAHRRKLVALVALAAVVAGGAVGLAQTVESTAQQRLVSEQAQAVALSAQVAKFSDVRAQEDRIALGDAAVKVGSSTLIDWQAQITAIEASMPAGYTVTAINANGATPLVAYPQGNNLLEPTRVATVTMSIDAGSVGEEFSTWLRALRTTPAYADATANSTYDNTNKVFVIDLTMHLSPKAISAGTWTVAR